MTVLRTSQQDRDETPSQRADRNFLEIVQELRVVQTGVQILFAFLLSLAFLGTFPRDDRAFDAVLTAALVASAGAALCFMAPAVAHRLHFRTGRKERLVWVGHWMLLHGMLLLVLAMDLALWLVLAAVWSKTVATATTVALPAVAALLWVALPALVITHAERAHDDEPEPVGTGSAGLLD
jgi:amino acid transporter